MPIRCQDKALHLYSKSLKAKAHFSSQTLVLPLFTFSRMLLHCLSLSCGNASTCKCPSSSFQMTSLATTIYVREPLTAMYTWKFGAACTVYHKLASWQTSHYANSLDNMATLKYNTHPDFGNTSPSLSSLICGPTTLVSNTSAMGILSTSFLCYALKCTKLLMIGMAISTAALISGGTMANIW